jgi:hypothetical protein
MKYIRIVESFRRMRIGTLKKPARFAGRKNARVPFGSMRRRSALAKPDILVELVDFAFRGKEIAPPHDPNPDGLTAGGDSFLQCLAEGCEKTAGVRSTPYPHLS